MSWGFRSTSCDGEHLEVRVLAVLRFRGRAVNRHGDHLRMMAEDVLRDAARERHASLVIHDGGIATKP
jgi:hypothetical protein